MSKYLEIPLYDAKVITVARLMINSLFCFWKKPIIEMGYFDVVDGFIARVSYQNLIWPDSKPIYAGMLHNRIRRNSRPVVFAKSYQELEHRVRKFIPFSPVTFKILTNETLHSYGKLSGVIKLRDDQEEVTN